MSETVNFYKAASLLTSEERHWLKTFWEELRGPNLYVGLFNLVPDLAPSLELLTLEGYGLSDIANMFGLADSAVGRWFKQAGIVASKETRARVWSDVHHRFVPVSATMANRLRIRAPQPRRDGGAHTSIALMAARVAQARRPPIEVCVRGHPATPENRRGPKGNVCRLCTAYRRRRRWLQLTDEQRHAELQKQYESITDEQRAHNRAYQRAYYLKMKAAKEASQNNGE